MMLNNEDFSAQRAQEFYKTAVSTQKVFIISLPEEKIWGCESTLYEDVTVYPFWSSTYEAYAKAFAKPLNLPVVEIAFDVFFVVLDSMSDTENPPCIGINWNNKGFGVEYSIEDVFEGLLDEMEKQDKLYKE